MEAVLFFALSVLFLSIFFFFGTGDLPGLGMAETLREELAKDISDWKSKQAAQKQRDLDLVADYIEREE